MSLTRSSGILLHPTSLPGRYGIGDLGQESYRFVDFLADSKQQLWQILPLGPTGHGNSPYMCYSAMAGNPLLISLDELVEQGLLSQTDLAEVPIFSSEWVDYDQVIPYKLGLLKLAAQNFKAEDSPEFQAFCQAEAFWLEDYSLFIALKDANDGASWSDWDPAIATRQPEALETWRSKLADTIFLQKFLQFEFCRQWFALKAYANERHIQIIGDMPIYVAHDSADVWAFPENFMIDGETLQPSLMAGVPPDYFSETGQLWGNPTYNWQVLEETQFDWWIKRIKTSLAYVDQIRIDHFRGFESFWAVEAGEETALNGTWVEAPGVQLFERVEAVLGKLPFLAEDLGVITPEVEALRDQFGFPGMKILQFAFGSDHRNPYLPFNCDRNFVIYTGTHDNDTTVGWYNQANDYEKQRLANFVGALGPESVHWAMIRLALSSVANFAIIPLQDLLGLGTEARMNTPGVAEGNWAWRFDSSLLTPTVQQQFTTLTELYGRATHQWSE
ncbi:4-alpha-glucanotransferase [Leptothoe sp. PORK10 BA2]|uniref:4-alpha-glucanotransferase n=1 Tax=Leptothoe sp. PORK10 BA2 TaxID=3110254 RepID=UPI002B1F53D6|nr:4-alpha-glucanotransferase [Leptothoe sp. PORK10 BA2]MEA5463436.1 4-alpha-glucanotransferase [Leptothoe sp. PORK10 BA2]